MREVMMLAFLQAGVHHPPEERTPLGAFTRPAKFDGPFESPPELLVEQTDVPRNSDLTKHIS
jgi:hypothetical protein